MRTQIVAFAMLFMVLIGVDAIAFRGEYRGRVAEGIGSTFGSARGLGPGRDWSRPKPQRND